ncbi:hypothetical protein AtubIFM56815_002774 [Aspergillus tubingensis]|uniref:Rhodopsin domain-containing protein n=1 Tax=Aspergillus tubingensis TaxID=5068 RepID=A0A8H3SQP7_ASPTU|nr:putative feruloyl esterase A [Aspergillus tubingensis]GFN13965.1 putative feruloyl esterase A [Aspergillus tubingensis]GLA67517.1 hypothetical protein AtubIFM54640_010836 [Aspergillus tubingensis]GLA88326.1 hypothetical protein AtubIFM56815_002774 [Aspergillus tubingensis]GLA94533.1 hypothetical protein AtubIFM57143_001522 [Aspergillus tubingensis]GLB12630.1 hypothetical protein AtubIFM61612_000008 [Aspergillus tubingensis]
MAAPYGISPTDRSGVIVIAATLFMSWMVLVSLFRVYMRVAMNGPAGWDDVVVWIGGAIGIGNVGAIMKGVSQGLGRINPTDEEGAMKALYTADLLFLASHGASKVSVCLLLRRLGREGAYIRLCTVGLAVLVLWFLASLLAVGLQCEPSQPWNLTQCHSFVTGWRAMTAFDVITEALLVGLSIRLVWGVQMRRTQKAGVIGAFGTRILIIALIIVRQCYLNRVGLNNMLLGISNVVVATEVLLHSSLMAATVPCLKPFVIAFNTGWGQGGQKDGSYLRSETSEGPPFKARSRPYPADDEITMIPTGGARECEENLEASGGLVIHQTREWSLRTEYIEMQPLKGPEPL